LSWLRYVSSSLVFSSSEASSSATLFVRVSCLLSGLGEHIDLCRLLEGALPSQTYLCKSSLLRTFAGTLCFKSVFHLQKDFKSWMSLYALFRWRPRREDEPNWPQLFKFEFGKNQKLLLECRTRSSAASASPPQD